MGLANFIWILSVFCNYDTTSTKQHVYLRHRKADLSLVKLTRALDLLSHANEFVSRAHNLLSRAHDLLSRAHEIRSRAHNLVSRDIKYFTYMSL